MTRKMALSALFTPFVLFSVGCYEEVEGERAADIAAGGTGCPEGEVCSDDTPLGLTFVGQGFYDDGGTVRLGPVLVGGTFDVSFYGDGLGSYDIDVTDENIGPQENGNPVITLRMRYDAWKAEREAP